jgi:hypothetical protein
MLQANIPAKFPVPFAASSAVGDIRPIPLTQPSPGNGQASLETGFPPEVFTPPGSGGFAPDGRDFQRILNWLSQWTQWLAGGGPIAAWDATNSTNIGGYAEGALVASVTTPGTFWLCTADSNTSNPDIGGANWVAWPTPPAAGIFTQFFVSSVASPFPSASATLVVPHTLGVIPKGYQCYLHCLTSEYNWAIGNEPTLTPFPFGSNAGCAISADASAFYLLVGTAGYSSLFDKVTHAAISFTLGNWGVVFRAWA